jgi:hypothetical protein
MQQMIKKLFCLVGLVLLTLPSARAFSLAGPSANAGDNWQNAIIGYPGNPVPAPKNIGEGYRPNVPVMYYAYTPAFLDYFGTAGETNIDSMFTNILNGAFASGVTNYTPGLAEVPLDSGQLNYTAAALQLIDIKSYVLNMMMMHLGLWEAEEDTWLLHARGLETIPNAKCPNNEVYTVIQRNYGITPSDYNTIQYSPYVNNTLYSLPLRRPVPGPILWQTPFLFRWIPWRMPLPRWRGEHWFMGSFTRA